MKIFHFWSKAISLITLLLLSSNFSIQAQILAFPGAEGYGKFAVGGRSGKVYHVTNLNDSGSGSLRDAVSSPNRIVVFDVAGTIKIVDRMVVAANIYIAGQTAPGEGITVYGNGWSFSNAHNTICRYLKIRMGVVGTSGKDANGLAEGHDMIFDHCSVSWGRDENFSINATNAQRITIQNSIISQGLLTHSAGGLIQTDGGVTLYRNLYVDNTTRNNKVKGVSQYVNNLVYNWKAGAYIMGGDSEGESFVNVAGNCFIKGPEEGVNPFSGGNSLFHIYAKDNISDTSRNGIFDAYSIPQNEYTGNPDFKSVPFDYPSLPTVPAKNLIESLLPDVGASLPYRDFADYYVINEVKSFGKKGEFIANESVLPFGAPTAWNLWSGTTRLDTDKDGMPDDWEKANGTNPNLDDAMVISSSGYANIENYINGINASASQEFLRRPLKLIMASSTQTQIELTWLDYSEKETGFLIERKINNKFVQIGTTGVNQNSFIVTGMAPAEADTFRVRAYNDKLYSDYSNELIAKSKPLEAKVIDPTTFVPDLIWSGKTNKDWDKTSLNWLNGSIAKVFTDSTNLSFLEAGTGGQTINLTGEMPTRDIVVNSKENYTFSGKGFISGLSSMNKLGLGRLSLQTSNTYKGATVLRAGVLEINTLLNGGLPSSIGASANYGFNLVFKGGKLVYAGATTSTDRSATIDATAEIEIANPDATVTMTGVLAGSGGLTKSGAGKLVLRSANPYLGETIVKGGILEVSPISSATQAEDIIDNGQGIGTSNILRLQGGTYRTTNGSTSIYENYPMHIYVAEGTENSFEPFRNANLNGDVSGNGTLTYVIPYLRELIQGDWSDFTGVLVANGVNTTDGSILMIDNGMGFPNCSVRAIGNTKISTYSNNNTLYLGGLSGNTGTILSCGGTKTASFGNGFTTWVVGGAGTDEVFNGVINNHLYGNNADGNGTTTIVKEGNGEWKLTGKNTYIGTTTINAGKLLINGSHTGTGKVTVNDGTLGGKGTIAAEVQVFGNLSPGDNGIGTLTLQNKLILGATSTVNVEINKTNATADKVIVTGQLTYDGVLNINVTGTPTAGDVYKIFEPRATTSGVFSKIVPAIPATGLIWKFNPSTGELAVQKPNFIEAPTKLTLTATSEKLPSPTSTVKCTWVDMSDNESYFVLERSLDSLTFVDIAHPVMNAVAYENTGLVPNKTYYFRIKAVGSSSESLYSTIVAIRTPSFVIVPDKASNPVPANGAQNIIGTSNKVGLSWSGNNTDRFNIYFGTSATVLTKLATVIGSTSPSFQTPELSPNTTYYWRVDAFYASDSTMGTVWSFTTADIPKTVIGDYRSATSGNWGTSTVSTAIWETYDGTKWVATSTIPTVLTPPAIQTVNTITIRAGHTVTLNVTTAVNNLVVETGATLKSGTSDGLAGTATQRTLRVVKAVQNFGTLGSSSTSTERINFEGYLDNGTITLGGTGAYFFNTFLVNAIAVTTKVDVDANLNVSGAFRANYSTSTTSPWTGASQNDDDITITIKEGRTVTLGSAAYLQAGSSPTTNTIVEFGKYTYNINGILDMKATGTSCIVEHATLTTETTINVNGTWFLGNAIRFITSSATVPVGKVNLNIGINGVIDGGARTIGTSSTATNIVSTSSTLGRTNYFSLSGNGVLKTKVSTTDVTFTIGTEKGYSPVKVANSGVADIIGVNVKSTLDKPISDSSKVIKTQYTITPSLNEGTNLAISLGWLVANQASNFTTDKVMIGRFVGNVWADTTATMLGEGSMQNPYYAKLGGLRIAGTFVVSNPTALHYKFVKFSASKSAKLAKLSWTMMNELNIQQFDLERSKDGIDFVSIATVSPKNNYPMTNLYEYTDEGMLKDTSYYRLKMIDKNNTVTYSERVAMYNVEVITGMKEEPNARVVVSPNPVDDVLLVSYPLMKNKSTLKLYDLMGREVKNMELQVGTTTTSVNVKELSTGIYTIALCEERGQCYVIKILKQ